MDIDNRKIEVISGDGKELEISGVETHISITKPKIKDDSEKKQEIVIPKSKKKEEKENNEEKKEN